MKSLALKTALTAIALGLVASSVSAAPTNDGLGKHCPVGQHAVVDKKGHWSCEDLTVGAKDKGMERAAAGNTKFAPKQSKPARAKSTVDLYVGSIAENYLNDPRKVNVYIRNQGNTKSGSAVLLAVLNGSIKKEQSIPSIMPNETVDRTIKFDRPLKKGDRIKFVVDSKNHVVESNENNNIKYFTY